MINGFYALQAVKKRNKRIGSTFWVTVQKLKELPSNIPMDWQRSDDFNYIIF